MALAKQAARAERANRAKVGSARAPRLPFVSLTLGALSCIGMMVTIPLIFFYAPTDALQGEVQRILYFHVPTAWIGMLAFVVQAAAGVLYLLKANERLDWIARASAEVGVVFLTITLILGSLWGKPVWGAWWTWDPKLTAALILWFMFIGYLMLRSYMGRTTDSARVGAVWSIVGVIDVPIIYLSVQWWRGQHPAAQVGVAGALPPEATLTLMVSLATFTLLYCFLMLQVYHLQRLQTLAQRLRASVE